VLVTSDLKTRKHRGALLVGSAIRSRRSGAHLQLNVHTPKRNEKQIPECRAQWERGMKSSRLVPVSWFSPSCSTDASGLKTSLREPRCCGTASPCGAGIVLRRELLLQRERAHARREAIAQALREHRIPSIAAFRENTEAGVLISYGFDLVGLFRDIAAYVQQIARGANPSEMPINQSLRFHLAVNLLIRSCTVRSWRRRIRLCGRFPYPPTIGGACGMHRPSIGPVSAIERHARNARI
jgi:hypothetical protein